MVFSGTATCQSDKEMGRLLDTLKKYEIDPDIYGRRVLVECVLKDGEKEVLSELVHAFEQVRVHGTCVSKRR